MSTRAKKPEIRFAGFENEWTIDQILNIVDIRSGKDYKYLSFGDIPVYGTGGYIASVNKALYSSGNAIGIGRKGTIDKPFILHAPFWTVDTLFYAVMKENNDLNFVFALFQNINWKSKDESTGVPSLSKTSINEVEVMTTKEDEQKAIGIFFSKIDEMIALETEKYEKLIIIKKAMLEKMFPKEGCDVPELRFSGYTGAWEQKRLGDCFFERTESMPEGELISVTTNDGVKKFSELGRHNNSNDDKSKYKKVCVGDIAYNSMRMWQGASGYSPYEGIVSPAYTVLAPNQGVDSKCVAYLFKRPDMIQIFRTNSQGITSDNWNLKYPALSEIKIMLPRDTEEQSGIASCLQHMDNLITLQEQKVKKLKNIKSACMEKMFV